MKTVQELIVELSNFPADKEVRFFHFGSVGDVELKIVEYDQDDTGNPTFMLECK